MSVMEHAQLTLHVYMAIASGPAGPVLAGPVITFAFQVTYEQAINECQ